MSTALPACLNGFKHLVQHAFNTLVHLNFFNIAESVKNVESLLKAC